MDFKKILLMLLLTFILGTFLNAGERTAVFVERLTNTGCGPCAAAGEMMESLTDEYGRQVTALQVHVNWPSATDPFYTYNTTDNAARWNHYDVSAVPKIAVDGKKLDSYSSTPSEVESRLSVSAPLSVSITVEESIRVDVDVESSVSGSNDRLFVAITQTNIYYEASNGENWHYDVLRTLLPDTSGQSIDLSSVGSQTFYFDYTWDSSKWDSVDMKAVAWVQDMSASYSSYNVYNSNWVWWPIDYRYSYNPGQKDSTVESATSVELAGDYLANVGLSSDTYALKLVKDIPSTWDVNLGVGSSTYSDSTTVATDPGDSNGVAINFTTDEDGIGSVDLIVTSSGSGRADTVTYKVSQNPEILLVDDDAGGSYESYYQTSLSNLGVVYSTHDRSSESLSATDMNAYDIVIWFTSDDYSSVVDNSDTTAISDYLGGGGALFMSSQDLGWFCDDAAILGWYHRNFKASYNADDADILAVRGASGGPFSGLSFSLFSGDGASFTPYPSDISAYGSGEITMEYDSGSYPGAGVVYSDSYPLIYLAFPWEAIGTQADRDTVMKRALNFLRSELTVNEKSFNTENRTKLRVKPNPFSEEIEINLKHKTPGRVRLSIVDIYGEEIIELHNEFLTKGEHTFKWNGHNPSGKALSSSIYWLTYKSNNSFITKKIGMFK